MESSTCTILDLPDLALYNICTHITCPFDLLHFGNTCSRIREVSCSPLLWQRMCIRSLHGLWVELDEGSVEENPRDWLLEVMRKIINKSTNTRRSCVFPTGEEWIRKDSPKFRFLVHLLQLSYTYDKDPHPAVLHEQWLYDIAIFDRWYAFIDFSTCNLSMDLPTATELSNLSQAAERDLRLRKQPYKDKRYYIKYTGSASKENFSELFPSSGNGSLCPLLLVPRSHTLGIVPYFPSLCEILIKRILKPHNLVYIRMAVLWEVVKTFCTAIYVMVSKFHPPYTLKGMLLNLFDEDSCNAEMLDALSNYYGFQIPYRDVIAEFCIQLCENKALGIEGVQENLRRQALNEIIPALFPPSTTSDQSVVSRVNLTDSDLIGGDNSHQEMSCAAWISDHAALVTWQLVGRSRY